MVKGGIQVAFFSYDIVFGVQFLVTESLFGTEASKSQPLSRSLRRGM